MISSGSPLLAPFRVTLGVTGSVAAYKAVQLLRLLQQAGAEVEIILSERATEFVGAATFEGLLGKSVRQSMFVADSPGEAHVALAKRSDLILIAPATADTLAKLASGRASDLLSATVLCACCPVWVAPAMHPQMWANAATADNVRKLRDVYGVKFIGPEFGAVASGDLGLGRMSEPELIVQTLFANQRSQDLLGRHLVITAGPTEEPLDPVRFLGNRSSGKTGYALAAAARARGAQVTLISGPVHLDPPANARLIQVKTALEMQTQLDSVLGADLTLADAVIMAAAVADFRPAVEATEKLKRSEALSLNLEPNPDIIQSIAKRRRGPMPLLVAFALETGTDAQLLEHARHKLTSKGVDLICANLAKDALGQDTTRAFFVTAEGASEVPLSSKHELAARLLDRVVASLASARTETP